MAGLVAGASSALEAKLNGFVQENRLPGAAAGVVHGDELAWLGTIGFADVAARRPTRPETLFFFLGAGPG